MFDTIKNRFHNVERGLVKAPPTLDRFVGLFGSSLGIGLICSDLRSTFLLFVCLTNGMGIELNKN